MSEAVETTVETETTSNVRPEVQALSDKIAAGIKLDESGSQKLGSDFLGTLVTPEEKEILEKAQKLTTDIGLAHGLAVGRVGAQFMADNKQVDVVSVTLPLGKDVMSATVQRSAEVGFGSNEKKQVYGRLTTAYKKSFPTTQVKHIRDNISAYAAELLKD